MTAAYLRVVRNKGCPGVDGMRVESLKSHLQEHGHTTKTAILQGTYKPQKVKGGYSGSNDATDSGKSVPVIPVQTVPLLRF